MRFPEPRRPRRGFFSPGRDAGCGSDVDDGNGTDRMAQLLRKLPFR
jgi:hypothetical protein